MKAHKQINLRKERKLVWTYSSLLIIMGVLIMYTPVLAQIDLQEEEPEVKVDVQNIYDEDGNLLKSDTVKTWCWSDKTFNQHEFDSLWNNIADGFHEHFPENLDDMGFHAFPHGPPMGNFWDWNESDSSAFSQLNDFFDEDFLKDLRNGIMENEDFSTWNFSQQDSLIHALQDFDEFNDKFHQDFDDFNERFEQYHEEHRQLIDKFFGEEYKPDQE